MALNLKDTNHLRSIIANNGLDWVSGDRFCMRDVLRAGNKTKVQDTMATSNMIPLLPQTITQMIRETVEPLIIGPSLLDRIRMEPGQRIVFPALGAFAAYDVAEGQEYPEVQPQVGGATSTAEVGKSGLKFKLTQELIDASQWDILAMTLREAGKAMARLKETKIFNFIRSIGVKTHNNVTPTASIFGATSGRDLTGTPNGSFTMDDLFDMWAQLVSQGFVPDSILINPLTWTMWMRDPVLRVFAINAGGGPWYGTHSGNPAGRAGWEGGLGVGSGQAVVGGPAFSAPVTGGAATSGLDDFPQNVNSAPNVPSRFPFPMRVYVSPYMPFDPASRRTDIIVFDSSRLGALLEAEPLTVERWEDMSVDIQIVKVRERYGLGIYEEGHAVAVAKNVKVVPNEIVFPPQTTIAATGTFTTQNRATAIT